MKTKNVFILLSVPFSLLLWSPNNYAQDKKKTKETVKFYVETMECENCRAKIEKNIAFEKGVTDIKTDLNNKMVSVTFKTDKTNLENLKKGFKKIGYEAIEVEEINKNM